MPYTVLDPSTAAAAPVLTLGAPKTNYGKTLLALRTRLQRQLSNRDDLDATVFDELINDAYIDICSSLKLPELLGSYTFNTLVGQPLYMLPDSVEYIRHVSIVDSTLYAMYGGRPLEKIDLDAYRKEPVLQAEPMDFFRENEMLVLYPTPNSIKTISVDIKIEPQPLVADTDSPILPVAFHEVILKAARAKAYEETSEFDLAALADNAWIGLLRRKEDPLAEEETGRLVRSSVPRRSSDLFRARPLRRDTEII